MQQVRINLDGTGRTSINTGVGFFDHMLEQLCYHAGFDCEILCRGDLEVDEHHTVEDTAIVVAEVIREALAQKSGINRYGFLLPMDESLATVAIDLCNRSTLVWDVQWRREKIGAFSTEMVYHFFKTFTENLRCALHVSVVGKNEHHKCEAIFKAVGKVLKQACCQKSSGPAAPTTKGKL